jgi:hypothetical protein
MSEEKEQVVWNPEELKEGASFVGRIEKAEWTSSEYGSGRQLHLQIRPLDHEVKGESGCYHEWYNPSRQKRSKWGMFVTRLHELGATPKKDEKDLEGKVFEWETVTETFIEGGDEVSFRLPCRLIGEEKKDVSFAELEKMLKESGMTKAQIKRWAMKNGVPSAKVDEYMKSLGARLKEEEGTYFLE